MPLEITVDVKKLSGAPENYKHSDLPSGRNLQGEALRSAIDDAIRPFLRDEAISKLTHVGSTPSKT